MPNPYIILNNFAQIADILQTIGIIMGIGMIMGAFFLLKKYGETRTYMSHQMTIAGPLMMMLGGVLMLMLPTTISTFLYAFWGTYTPVAYVSSGSGWDEYVPVVLMLVRLMGVAAIMRGVVTLSRVGGVSAQPGAMGRALIFITCGILSVHILGTYQLLLKIFDYTT